MPEEDRGTPLHPSRLHVWFSGDNQLALSHCQHLPALTFTCLTLARETHPLPQDFRSTGHTACSPQYMSEGKQRWLRLPAHNLPWR